MEAQGSGVHIVMSARTALELGAPIRGILAFTSTSTYSVFHKSIRVVLIYVASTAIKQGDQYLLQGRVL